MSTRRISGPARILVAVYAVLAAAATGRSVFQIIDRFAEAPIAYSLSAASAVVYIVATLALALGWRRVAWVAIGFEFVGVLLVGALSVFGKQGTVWALFGAGYVFVPLVVPVIGLVYLFRHRRVTEA